MYFLNYLDRNALPQARLNTLEEDLNLEGVQYNTAISILFVGYIIMQGKRNVFRPPSSITDFFQFQATCFLPKPNHASISQSV
jgi:hypothetical protein